MSAPRVPAGWTQVMAGLVREDWELRVAGGRAAGSHIFPCPPSPMAGLEVTVWMLENSKTLQPIEGIEFDPCLIIASLAPLGIIVVDSFDAESGESKWVGWASEGHALRAWAAVGAPVLAPAEDGRPSLAEWVAACEGSALGRPVRVNSSGRDWHFVGCCFVQLIDNGAIVLRRDGTDEVTTPAELRALLDTLARPA